MQAILSAKPETKVLIVIFAIILITIVANAIASLDLFGRDTRTWSYIGKVILQGQVPYRDVWDHKSPGL